MSGVGPTQLGEVASFVRGITFKPDDVVPVGSPGSVACMRTKNVQTELDLSDVWGIPGSLVKREDQYLESGDLLVSSANSWNLVGKCCWVPELPWRATFGGFISVLRGDSERIEPRYLYHWFSSSRVQATVRSFGQQTTNISNLNVDRCERLTVPLPPLPEQRRIAEILDKADALRAKRRTAIAQLDALSQSIFLDMFGDPATNPKKWPVFALGTLVRDVTNGMTRRRAEADLGQSIVLRLRDIREGWIDFSEVNRITLNIDEAQKYEVSNGDLLFIRVNGNPDYVGRCALFTGYPEQVYFNDHVMRVRIDGTAVDGMFLISLLNGAHGKGEIAKHRKTSAGQHTINQDGLSRIRFPLPPIRLQHEFASRVAAVDACKRTNELALRTSDGLFASIQECAFQGAL
jgi:type I restriction enzyme S subunit